MLAEANLILFFGRLHPLLVHLPIGFLSLLAAVELAARLRRFHHVGHARGIILAATALSAVSAVVCGLMLASDGAYDGDLLTWHKWLGITLAGLIIASAVALWAGRPRIYTGLFVTTLAVMMPASHMGGSMTHGKEYLTEYAPAWLGGHAAKAATPDALKITDPLQADLYRDLVQPALQQNCLGCHGADKSSGGLRLDTLEATLRGGKSGPAAVSHDALSSLLVQRMRLAGDDPQHMPPPGRPQPTSDQAIAIRWWIDAGLPSQASVGSLEPGAEQADAAARLLKLPVAKELSKPQALADLGPAIADAAAKSGAQIVPFEVGSPWLTVNAAVSQGFGDAQLAALGTLANNIVSLNLARSKVTDEGLAVVRQMPNLRELRLDGTRVGDVGLKHLTRLRKLEYLNLYGTQVTDAGLPTLKGLPALNRLYLWQTKVTSEATTRFAESRTDLQKIESLTKQIAELQTQIANEQIKVVGGVSLATTRPTSQPATQPTTTSSTQPATMPATQPTTVPATQRASQPAAAPSK